MTPERWARLAELFESAIDLPAARRSAFLEAACRDDAALRHELERLLESDSNAPQLDVVPAVHFAAAESAAAQNDVGYQPGARLGRYEVLDLLGAGGMGEVYRARDPQLGREVGVKVLRRRGEIAADQMLRFEREARAAGGLHHPNIVAVYDIGMHEGMPFVVSELLEGETLRDRLVRGPLRSEEVRAVATQIASGLAAAHEKGIVHRDLKPENMFITHDGVVKILDFGLAKDTAQPAETPVTADGLVIGTAGYMSPEQVRGLGADARSDVFSFGAVLYEMATGRRAFRGDSAVETMHAVLANDPAPASSASADLEAVWRRCLAKQREHRYASGREIREALASTPKAQPRWPQPRWTLPAAWGIAAALLIVSVAAALVLTRRPQPPRAGAAGRPALAVLPFEDRSGDPTAAWLTAGVPSMLVTALAQTPGLDVIGSERLDASFRELERASTDRSAYADAARRAGAGAMLLGTFFKIGAEMRLSVQVQDVATGRVVAARVAQGPDLFALVDGIAAEVRAALDVANRPAGRPLRDVTTASLDAYELYAKAQRARHNNRWADARTLFAEALRIDPSFTLARAQMVTMLDRLGEHATAAAERAIAKRQLHQLPERQRLLAEAVQEYDTNPARALALLERLIERYPDEEEAYDAIIHAYTHTRDPAYWKKALPFMQRWARAIPGPGSGHFHNHYGYAYIEHGLFTEAEREFRAYIRVSPDEANGYDSLAELLLMTGRPALALEQYDRALALNPRFGWSHFGRAYSLAMIGRYDEAISQTNTLQALGAQAAVPRAVVHMLEALLRGRVGRHQDALASLAAARRFTRDLGDEGGGADVELFAAMQAIERGEHGRAIEHVARAARSGPGASPTIMRVRRDSVGQLLAGVAEVRLGHVDAARRRVVTLRALDENGDPIQESFRHALDGEIALATGRVAEAESAFRSAEYRIDSSFAIYPGLVMLANNLPTRDGLARAMAARGDTAGAAALYARLNQPGVTSTSTAVFEPRYLLAAARLAVRDGAREDAAARYRRFAELWRGADRGVAEQAEALRYSGESRAVARVVAR